MTMEPRILFKAINDVAVRFPAGSFGFPAANPQSSRSLDLGTEHSTKAWILLALADPLIREAIEISSPALGIRLERIVAEADSTTGAQLKRAALSLLAYVLRMQSRGTPFGLVAYSTLGKIVAPGEVPRVASQPLLFKRVRADSLWTHLAVRTFELMPAVLTTLKVRRATSARLHGPYALLDCPNVTGSAIEDDATECASRSIILTEIAQELMQLCKDWQHVGTLIRNVVERTGCGDRECQTEIFRLLSLDLLTTELAARPGVDDVLVDLEAKLRVRGHPQLADLLANASATLHTYERAPLGQGIELLRNAQSVMSRLASSPHYVMVDSFARETIELPSSLGDRVAEAATMLIRVSRTRKDHLDEFRRRFLERYDLDRWVPLPELLDAHRGLGPPPRYMHPTADRRSGVDTWVSGAGDDANGPESAGRSLRNALYLEAIARGAGTVRLTPQILQQYLEPPEVTDIPRQLEIFATLTADSASALSRGAFTLSLGPHPGGPWLGAARGRLAWSIGIDQYERLAMMNYAQILDAIPVVVESIPHNRRYLNVSNPPSLPLPRLAVGFYPDLASGTYLSLDEILVSASQDRFLLYSTELDKIIVPFSGHMLRPRNLPNTARFLLEVGNRTVGNAPVWEWAELRDMPYLPRIESTGAIMSLASWGTEGLQLKLARNEHHLHNIISDWRHQWKVPDLVWAAVGDQRIELHLNDPAHRELLARWLRRRDQLRIYESLSAYDRSGEKPSLSAEIVVSLAAMSSRTQVGPTLPAIDTRLTGSNRAILPGGSWLYMKIYLPTVSQDLFLRQALLPALDAILLSGICNSWHFVRYRDPDPHLRIRFKGDPRLLWSATLPKLAKLASDALDPNFPPRVVVDTYEPEYERYGGYSRMPLAEAYFEAESSEVLTFLGQEVGQAGDSEKMKWVAARIVRIFSTLGISPHEARLALLGTTNQHRKLARDNLARSAVLREWTTINTPSTPATAALATYADGLMSETAIEFSRIARIGNSLAHMLANRVFGVDAAQEANARNLSYRALASLGRGGSA